MPGRVAEKGEILLNSVPYPITGSVKSALASTYPEKQVTGDYTYDSQRRASVWVMNDWRKGIGLNKARTPSEILNRCYWSTCNLGYHGHLVPPALATITAASGASGSFTIGAI